MGEFFFIGKYGARYFNNVGWFSFAIDDPFTPEYFVEKVREQLQSHCLYQRDGTDTRCWQKVEKKREQPDIYK